MQAKRQRTIELSSDRLGTEQLEQFKLQTVDILESVTDAFAAFDSKWRFTYVNAAAERLLGFNRQEIVGRDHWELFPQTRGTIVEENYRRAASEGVVIQFEFYYPLWKRWFSIRCYPAANGGLTNYFLDVTEAKLADQEMKRRNEALERANKLLEEFAYISSHDLQEPIRNIMISAELLSEEIQATKPEAKQFVEGIYNSARTLERLVRDLLAYSKVIHTIDGEACIADLSECLRDAVAVLQPQIDEAGAKISWGALPSVSADRLQITHVLQNLLTNSLKYRRPDVELTINVSANQVSTGGKDGGWNISFSDNGIGFESRHAERIFGLFKRLHRDGVYPGTGLGLAICRRIVERFGGSIWAEGKPGKGAVFHMTLKGA